MPMIEASKDFVLDVKKQIENEGNGGKLEKFAIDEYVHHEKIYRTDIFARLRATTNKPKIVNLWST